MNFDNYLIRCSSLGAIMTDGRSKTEPLGETCKSKLIECFVTEKYGREKEITSKYIAKGLAAEEDSLTLYSRLNKKVFFKNEERFTNEYLSGTPDLIDGDCILDIKTSWDLFTFYCVKTKEINKAYYLQLQGYMALTGATKAKLCYCLVNTPEPLINDEKTKLMYSMGAATSESPDFLKGCEEIEKAMKFDDIPMIQKVIEFEFMRDDLLIDKIYQRVALCREFLNEFSNSLSLEVA